MKLIHVALSAVLFLAPAAVFAQTSTYPQDIHQRKVDQQERIRQGVRDGQLTGRETGHLERQEFRVNREERHMRFEDHGRLTRRDRHILRQQQNRESRRIYRDKHNARVR